jgi:hypothetical protein
MVHDHWTPDLAFAEMKRYKFGADFLHQEFKTFVYGFQTEGLHLAPSEAKGAEGRGSFGTVRLVRRQS